MKQITIRLDIFQWDVHYFFISKKDKDINDIAEKYKMLDEDRNDINDKMSKNYMNGGLCLTHYDNMVTIVFIYPQTTKKNLFNLIGHETWHVVDRLTEKHNINDVETSALIQGYLLSEVLTQV